MRAVRRIALALVVVLTGVVMAAPAEGKRRGPVVRQYELTQAEGMVRITFHGDEGSGCRVRGTCGLSGTTTYTFGGKPTFGEVIWAKQRKRTIIFYGFFETAGETASDVVSAGSQEHCVDRTQHEYESMTFEPRSKRVRFDWRQIFDEEDEIGGGFIGGGGGGDDPFDTRCAGPALVDLDADHAIPFADVPYRVFRSERSTFNTTGRRLFAGGGFAGSVDWDLAYGLELRSSRGTGFFAVTR